MILVPAHTSIEEIHDVLFDVLPVAAFGSFGGCYAHDIRMFACLLSKSGCVCIRRSVNDIIAMVCEKRIGELLQALESPSTGL